MRITLNSFQGLTLAYNEQEIVLLFTADPDDRVSIHLEKSFARTDFARELITSAIMSDLLFANSQKAAPKSSGGALKSPIVGGETEQDSCPSCDQLLSVKAQLDEAGVPKESASGELLTTAQRVAWLRAQLDLQNTGN